MIPAPVRVAGNTRSVAGRNVCYSTPCSVEIFTAVHWHFFGEFKVNIYLGLFTYTRRSILVDSDDFYIFDTNHN